MICEAKLRNYRLLMGDFEDPRIEDMYRVVEKNFELKKTYSSRDWLTQNRQEVPQSFPEYYRNQIQARKGHPKIQKVLIVQLWTD